MISTEPLPAPADESPAPETPAIEPAAVETPIDALAHAPIDTPIHTPIDTPVAPAPRPPEMSAAECAQQLKQRFPALFTGAPKPIKLRIHVDIHERAPGVFTKHALSAFFRRHTGTTSYLQAVAHGTQRFDLDGQPQGDITAEHRQIAVDELARRRSNQAGQQAEQRAAARAADVQAHEARALEIQQRRNRAGLLYDYERTTLTRANFCVLKGVAEAELDGLLAIARDEAAQPRGPEQRGGGRDLRGADSRGGRDDRGPRPRAPGGQPGSAPRRR